MLEKQLLELDFTPNQAKVYMALIQLGQAKVGQIIKETGFHRNIIYRALDDLQNRGLIFHLTKSGVKYYEATSPEPLLAEIKRREQTTKQVIAEISKRKTQTPAEVQIFSGRQGIEELNAKTLATSEDLYLIGANGVIRERYPDLFAAFEKKRIEQGIKRFHLSTQETANSPFNEQPNTSVRYLPPQFSSPYVTWICGDKIAHVLWEEPELVFYIHHERIARDYKKYFDLLWSQNVKTFTGDESPQYAFGDITATMEPGESFDIMGLYKFDEAFRDEVLDFHKKRSAKGIKVRILMNNDAKEMYSLLSELPHTEIRLMDEGVFTPAIFLLYKNKTLISLGDDFSFFQIESEKATQAFQTYFQILWDKSGQ